MFSIGKFCNKLEKCLPLIKHLTLECKHETGNTSTDLGTELDKNVYISSRNQLNSKHLKK